MSQKSKKNKNKIDSKLAENFKSCGKSQKLPKISKAAEKLLVAKPIAWILLGPTTPIKDIPS